MTDVLESYPDPDTLLERIKEYTKVDDVEASELYRRAGHHFNSYQQILSPHNDRSERHEAGYELEVCEMYLDRAVSVLAERDKHEVVGELE